MSLTDRLIEKLNILSGYPRLLQNTVTISQEVALLRGMISNLRRPSPFVLVFIQGVRVERRKRVSPPVEEPIEQQYSFPARDYGFRDAVGHGHEEDIVTDKPVTLALSHEVPHMFSFQPEVSIAKLQIAVICDVRVVRIENIVVANFNLCPSHEAAPLAYHEGIVAPYNKITISTSLR